MIGTIEQMIKDMEHGVYDFAKDGKCSQCGACCSDLLPISESEYSRIKRYIKKRNIKEQDHTVPAVLREQPKFDLTCPFLNENKKTEKCSIYPAVLLYVDALFAMTQKEQEIIRNCMRKKEFR